MSLFLVCLVLAAAVLHASWNALAKSAGSPAYAIAAYRLVASVISCGLIFIVPFPAPESWPYLAGSVIVHNVYYVTLAMSYRSGDLSLVYPIFRGLAPVLVAISAAVFFGEHLTPAALFGVVLVSTGLVILPLLGARANRPTKTALKWGLATSALIAFYTVLDGAGVRASGTEFGYITWLFVFEVLPIGIWLLCRERSRWLTYLGENKGTVLFGGIASSLAYGMVIYAMSFGAMALVSSLRETSVIFAAIIGTVFLREPFGKQRIFAASVVALGVVTIRYFGGS
ncbi:MAG: DMT family transporter [Acidiferrobacterales bacterium]|nr:DMT family transporter [Acidiferrobacterales bacterium]